MDEESWEAWVQRYGLRPVATDLGEVREMVRAETALGWDADVELMRVGCVQLFNAGALADVLTVWRAKEANFDAHCSIEIQLLCGAGLDEAKTHLAGQGAGPSVPRVCDPRALPAGPTGGPMRKGGGAGLITVRQVPATAARESIL
ncbi:MULTISPECIES: hypothetical protein [unclassified Pseudofrankia]|uniref:hypothetical protein n=1 Tax=unclassified Pseudofrankia TaxID=2994372 RepID=UPI0008DB0954|nr:MULTISPECIES: hypothetical protein [unclassified Pseudofrankia]MDT3444870.1 hypothetical protein [Pseudofrankia sp. BMG5.37]OHV74211.1 hypothetical protein BCD48_32545 [Pseudofrankia sp. BMG5.36]